MRRAALPAAAALALLGYWAPWLSRATAGGAAPAALQLNAYELSEWLTFTPAGQTGALPVNRLTFLLPSACLALLFALAAGQAGRDPAARRRGWLAYLPAAPAGWLWLLLAGLCVVTVFPYYPYILTAYKDPEFAVQFWTAAGTGLLGLAALTLTDDAAALTQMALALAGAALSAYALWGLWPAAGEVLGGWTPGWGVFAAGLGFLAALTDGWQRLFRPR